MSDYPIDRRKHRAIVMTLIAFSLIFGLGLWEVLTGVTPPSYTLREHLEVSAVLAVSCGMLIYLKLYRGWDATVVALAVTALGVGLTYLTVQLDKAVG